MKSPIQSLILLLFFLTPFVTFAQAELPCINPTALYTTVEGEELDDATTAQSAPLQARFFANPENTEGYTARYEWTITHHKPTGESQVIVHRFDEDIEYTFMESGSFAVRLQVTFVQGTDTISLPDEGEDNAIMVSICESKLEFPNAFSPNGDGYNDVYRAKDGYQSIVQFKAIIVNRWGQKIYEWDSPDGSWDGTWHGRTVDDGVYYVTVTAKGADGRKYHIRKAVNVLTGYDNSSKTGGEE